jgi:hypothetical protein
MLILRSQGKSYPYIGRLFNKDHSTVIHWCRRFKVDIGSPVPESTEFFWQINKISPPNKYKYVELIEEPVNLGKKSYAEYLAEYQERNKLRR